MFLTSLAIANPPHTFTQADTWHALQSHPNIGDLKSRSLTLLEKILTNTSSGIEHRQFSAPDLDPVFRQNAEELNHAFERDAPALAAQAISKALEKADLPPEKIDALFLCTCTGYLCPALQPRRGKARLPPGYLSLRSRRPRMRSGHPHPPRRPRIPCREPHAHRRHGGCRDLLFRLLH